MEQRTFLAIVISFLFLMSYNALVVTPQQKKNPTTNNNQSLNSSVSPTEVNNKPILNENNTESDKEIQIGSFKITIGEQSGIVKQIWDNNLQYSPILTNLINFSSTQILQNLSQTANKVFLVYQDGEMSWQKSIEVVGNNKLIFQISPGPDSNTASYKDFNIFSIDSKPILNNPEIMRDNMLFEYSYLHNNKVFRKSNAYKFTSKDNQQQSNSVDWFGWRDRYHFTLVKPLFKCQGYSTHYSNDHQMDVSITNCSADEKKAYTFEVYMGPQDMELLNSLGGNIHKIMAFSGNPILEFIEKMIYKLILVINKVTKNWGVSIILISVLIYGITYPLTFKSMMSMKKMQELQPKMAELREKYKNDPQKLNTEVVQLYKIHNINPLGGCLPMLLQMPVFISLYQVLWRTHNFQNANFLWIEDLSKPDRALILNLNLPFIGNELNVLPILMAIVMFFQQKLSSKNIVITDPSQEMQQKMMTFIFPVFIGGIFYHFASGLTLYFTIFYIMSTLMQYQMSKIKKS